MADWYGTAILGTLLLTSVVCFCGHWPIFEGTPIQSLNNLCAGGGFDLLEKIVGLICGERGRRVVLSMEHYCCERPNPILQLFYLTMIGGVYYAAVSTSFQYIPGPYVFSGHKYVGTGCVVVGIGLFLLTSFSDPGNINSTNVADYLTMYPYDGLLYEEKTCSTCNLARPPRSKHCSICGHCIARFDHHCGWTNTCIGENNIRYFLAFLFWHCFACLYGVFVIGAIIAGEMKKRNLLHILTVYYGIEPHWRKLSPYILQWILAYYREQFLLILFLGTLSLLLMGFFSYHLYLVIINTTTNETYKWESYKRWKQYVSIAPGMEETFSDDAVLSSGNCFKTRFKLVYYLNFFKRRKVSIRLQRDNIYDKGALQNLAEVLFPRSCRLWWSRSSTCKEKGI